MLNPAGDKNPRQLTRCPTRFLQLAVNYEFVGHAAVALSAGRLAAATRSASACEDATLSHATALRGMREALASISPDNADAILGASILLLNQQDSWFVGLKLLARRRLMRWYRRAWKALMQGMSAVSDYIIVN